MFLSHRVNAPLQCAMLQKSVEALPQSLRKVELHSTSCNALAATRMLRDLMIAGHVTPCNFSCNLCRNKIARQVARKIAQCNTTDLMRVRAGARVRSNAGSLGLGMGLQR